MTGSGGISSGKSGVCEYWIVDPESKTIEVMGWIGSDFKTLQVYPANASFKSPMLEGFSFQVADIFNAA